MTELSKIMIDDFTPFTNPYWAEKMPLDMMKTIEEYGEIVFIEDLFTPGTKKIRARRYVHANGAYAILDSFRCGEETKREGLPYEPINGRDYDRYEDYEKDGIKPIKQN